VTSRHLRRAFAEHIGIGPKDFARTVRLQRAVRLSRTSQDWSRIAAEAGYYDQAHLIADFHELVGVTPGAFAKREAQWGARLGSVGAEIAAPAAGAARREHAGSIAAR
jgi:AraC-like DNA-binding protein